MHGGHLLYENNTYWAMDSRGGKQKIQFKQCLPKKLPDTVVSTSSDSDNGNQKKNTLFPLPMMEPCPTKKFQQTAVVSTAGASTGLTAVKSSVVSLPGKHYSYHAVTYQM